MAEQCSEQPISIEAEHFHRAQSGSQPPENGGIVSKLEGSILTPYLPTTVHS